MINQTELLDGLIHQMAKGKEELFEEFRKRHERPGVSVDELNAQYRANYQATQDALLECMRILIKTKYDLKNK